ncbi:MAG: S41 family peptidase, partial [Firmicutes bacterium]|nr:S41 family peptidase [Bacillota bacterium]
MKKKVITIVFLLLTAVTIGCSIINDEKSVGIKGVNFFDPEFPIQVEQLKPGDIIDEFDAIVATIDKWFALKERKNIASDLLNQHFRERMSQASDKDQLLEILTEMFATLDNGHSRLFESRTNGLARATIIEDNFVITSMAETSALVKHEVQVGWLITQIDDMPIRQWINLQQKYFGGSDQWVRRNLEYHVFMRFPFQAEERTYTLLDEQGAEHNVTIPLQNSFSEFMDACLPQEMVISERMEIEGYIFGYISIHEMSHLALAEFDKHLAKLLDANGIIIDLRNNSG